MIVMYGSPGQRSGRVKANCKLKPGKFEERGPQ